jgi:MOSC domain-containing protein YiiM
MNQVGKVLSLYLSEKGISHPNEQNEIQVDIKGIINDKHYNKDIERSILVTSTKSYELVKSHMIEIPYGILGENLLIDFNPYNLPIGSQLKIGNTILEISQKCTLCNHLSRINKQLPTLLKNDRGIFGKVIQAGSIKVGDKIYLLED